MIVKNLFCAIKTVAGHVLSRVPICGNVHYEEDLTVNTKGRRDQDLSDDYGEEIEDEITKTIEKQFNLRKLNEDEKLSAGESSIMSYSQRFKAMHQSVAGIKGSQLGGIHETVILDELIHEDDEDLNIEIQDRDNETVMGHNPMHDSIVDLEKHFLSHGHNSSSMQMLPNDEVARTRLSNQHNA